MKKPLMCLALLCLYVTIHSQSFNIRAPRISNWQFDQAMAKNMSLWITPGATFVQVDMDFTISAERTFFNNADTLEAVINFNIPEGAFITDSWLWIGDDIIKARIQDRWSAEDQFEEIVNRNRDPSILTKIFNNQYELKVFPMTKSWDRKVRITMVIPAALANGKLKATFPHMVIPANQIEQDRIPIQIHYTEPFGIPKLGDATFEVDGEFIISSLDNTQINKPFDIEFLLPATDYLLQTYSTEADNYYGLNIDLEKFKTSTEDFKSFMLIVDYFSANNAEDLDDIANIIGQKLKAALIPTDLISLYCGNPDEPLAWVNANDEGLAKITEKISAYNGFSQMPDILTEGIGLAQMNEVDQIFFLTNSDPRWDVEQTALALSLVKEANASLIPIHSLGYQNINWLTRRINGQVYANNNYFLELLARESNGTFAHLNRNEALELNPFSTFENRGASPDNRALNVQVSNGATFENINLNENVVVGRYFGEKDFLVGLLDIANQKLDTTVALVENTKSINYPVLQQWTGHQLDRLTNGINNGYYSGRYQDEIFDIIELSLENRVLSTYTALFALEPSLGGKICDACKVEIAGGEINKDFVFNSLGLDVDVAEEVVTNSDDKNDVRWEIRIGPNPTRDIVRIEVSNINVGLDKFMAEIYNVSGRKILTKSAFSDYLILDVNQLEAGIYFLHVWVNNQKVIRKLVILE